MTCMLVQWAVVRHQHAVWCWRGQDQQLSQPASVLVQHQCRPQSLGLHSAAQQHQPDWQRVCALHLLFFF